MARAAITRFSWFALRNRIFDGIRPRICRVPSFTLQGKSKTSQRSLRSSVFAEKSTMHYFSQLSYDQEPEYRFAGPTAYSQVLDVARRTNADVVFIETNRIFSKFLISKGFIVLPSIDFVLDITGSLDSINSRMNRNKKRILRKIDELEYDYETTMKKILAIDQLDKFHAERLQNGR